MSIKREFEIQNRLGLHARASAVLVKVATRFESEVTVTKDGQAVNGKSILGMMTLAAAQGSRVIVECSGGDEAEALEAIGACIADRFGEDA